VSRDVGILYDVMKTAKTEELIDSNPVEGANRPRIPKRDWRILKPDEIRRLAKAFTDEQARALFLTLVLTGLRKSELQRLRWRDVSLVEKVLRVVGSKSESGVRSIAIPSSLAEELNGHSNGPRSRATTSWCSVTRNAGRSTRKRSGGRTSPPH
jgi:integrase